MTTPWCYKESKPYLGVVSYLPLLRAVELFLLCGFEELVQADHPVVIQVDLRRGSRNKNHSVCVYINNTQYFILLSDYLLNKQFNKN